MHDKLFQNQSSWSGQYNSDAINTFVTYAEELEIDKNDFTTYLTSGKYKELVLEDLIAGKDLGVNGIPTFYISIAFAFATHTVRGVPLGHLAQPAEATRLHLRSCGGLRAGRCLSTCKFE